MSEYSYRRDSGSYRPDCKACRTSYSTAQRYGITVGDVDRLREAQANACAICGISAHDIQHRAFSTNPLVIDHNHKTHQVRGLLCPSCNLAIGHLKDDPAIALKLYEYLVRFS